MTRRTIGWVGPALLLAACLPGETAPGDGVGTISGVVRYAGPEAGTLRVAVFAGFPPTGAPVAETAIDAPRFPQPYAVSGLPPGRYFVLAIVDVDPGDGDRYRPRVDPGGTAGRYDSPAAVAVDAAGPTRGVDIQLVAPAPGSPWDH